MKMKWTLAILSILLIVVLSMLLIMAGCTKLPPPTSDANVTMDPMSTGDLPYKANIDALHPGQFGLMGDMEVSPYETGAIVNQDTRGYKPYYLINRIQNIEEKKQVTTEAGEVRAALPIHWDLYKFTSISTSLPETLSYEGYDESTKSVIINGFIPDTTRILTITYQPVMTFNLYTSVTIANCKPKTGFVRAPAGYESWVQLNPTTVKMVPDATMPVDVTLTVPKEVKDLPAKWEFWVCVSLADRYNQGKIQTDLTETEVQTSQIDSSSGAGVNSIIESGNPYRVVMK